MSTKDAQQIWSGVGVVFVYVILALIVIGVLYFLFDFIKSGSLIPFLIGAAIVFGVSWLAIAAMTESQGVRLFVPAVLAVIGGGFLASRTD